MVKNNRKIGLGVMGWADTLVRLGIAYGSEESLTLAEKMMKFIQKVSHETSEALGKEKGNFPNFEGSIWEQRGYKYFRNATTTTIAPTGSISMIAGCSYGVEPLFALAFYKKVMGGYELPELNRDLVVALKRQNRLYSQDLIDKVTRVGSVQIVEEVPAKIREVFVTAMDITTEAHVRMQAAFQKHVDNAVSKTVNMPSSSSVEDVLSAWILAWKLKCKGITVYRDRSRSEQVLNVGKSQKIIDENIKKEKPVSKKQDACPQCGETLIRHEGCMSCQNCEYSKCSL
jgi:ribonucleoside-diphosphate reductase alpha chain